MKIILCSLHNNTFFEKETDVVRIIEISGCCSVLCIADGEAAKKLAEHGFEWSLSFPYPGGVRDIKFIEKGFKLKGHYESVIEILKKVLGEDTEVDLSLLE